MLYRLFVSCPVCNRTKVQEFTAPEVKKICAQTVGRDNYSTSAYAFRCLDCNPRHLVDDGLVVRSYGKRFFLFKDGKRVIRRMTTVVLPD